MNHVVTRGTDGHKIVDRVDLICSPDFRDREKMMDFDTPGRNGAKPFAEVDIADLAAHAVVHYAFSSSQRIPLICVYDNPSSAPFWK